MRQAFVLARRSVARETRVVSDISPFVGRARELEELTALLEEALAGRGAAAVVTGEPGIGKTRLVSEIARQAGTKGSAVAWGTSWEGGGQPAFWPWTQVLRALAGELGQAALENPDWAASLLRPLWGGVSTSGTGTSSEAEDARFALFDGLTEVLRRIADDHPLLVVLDDLHWADTASLLCLDFLARQVRSMRVMVLGTVRDIHEARDEAVANALTALARIDKRLSLAGMNSSEMEQLVEVTTEADLASSLSRWIHTQTGGNPLFATELLRGAARGDLRRGQLPAIPETVGDLIRQRVRSFGAASEQLLQAAAVLGSSFKVQELQTTVDADRDSVMRLLDGPLAAGLLVRAGPGTCTFAHPLVRESIEANLALSERVALHSAAATTLEKAGVGRTPAGITRLARHFLEAAPAGQAEKARAYATAAARYAVEQLAFEEAAQHLHNALDVSGADLAIAERINLLLMLSDAQSKAGDTSDAVEAANQAVVLADESGTPEQYAEAVLGCCLGSALHEARPDLVGQLERALTRLAPDSARLRARVTGRLAVELSNHSGSNERRVALADEAVELARLSGDRVTLAQALSDRHTALWTPEHIAARPSAVAEVLALGADTGDDELLALGHMWAVTAHLDLGNRDALERSLVAWAEVSTRLRRPAHRANVLGRRAMLAALDGRYDDARSFALQRAEVATEAGLPEAPIVIPSHEIEIGLEQTRGERFAEAVKVMAAMDEDQRTVVFHASMPQMLVIMGRFDEAKRMLRTWLPRIPDLANHWSSTAILVDLARAAGAVDEQEVCAALYEQLLPHRALIGSIAGGNHCVGSAALGLGMTATVLERWDDAETHFAEAHDMARRMRSQPWIARADYQQARMLARRNATGDSERARKIVARARAIAEELDMNTLLADLEALELPRPSRPRASLSRDGETWKVATDGHSGSLRDAKGLHYLAQLVATPGVEHHVLELVSLTEGAPIEAGIDRRKLGDAGPMLDHATKDAYRRRLQDLRDDITEAENFNDAERAAKAQAEIEALMHELSRAVGLGNRDRKAASASERARLNVTRALRSAIDRLTEINPRLGEHLDRTIRTGIYCAYEPPHNDSYDWSN